MIILIIIVSMALVTAIPRMIPAFLMDKFQFKGWVNRWLAAIPFAALGALIFPGILSVTEKPIVGFTGGIVALLLAYFGLNVILVVLGAILTVYLLSM